MQQYRVRRNPRAQCNQRSYVIIIARKEGGAWERVIINAPQAVDRGEGQGTAEVNGAGPSAMVVEKDVVGPSAMVVESDSVGPSPMVTEVGRYAQSSRPDGQLSHISDPPRSIQSSLITRPICGPD